ncbi:hypothetical protein J8273_5090 [Carpediemonas membranifera]|uniref:Uncharacterized protein n=1 Tax=Carpediemonas membranifera TaxID=201153 RepID=A0A8J6E0P6_9EUKA|nr:hypothetical protein J8273_5090 [Carpediemonas membranifera]|eukprot:KAG9392111.1 hypothetical protein J8273_5090 [Carpediemonas membranifera]
MSYSPLTNGEYSAWIRGRVFSTVQWADFKVWSVRGSFSGNTWAGRGSEGGMDNSKDHSSSTTLKRKEGSTSRIMDSDSGKRSRHEEDTDWESGSRQATGMDSEKLRLRKQLAEAQQEISALKAARLMQEQGHGRLVLSGVATKPSKEKPTIPRHKHKKAKKAKQISPMDLMTQFIMVMQSLQGQQVSQAEDSCSGSGESTEEE